MANEEREFSFSTRKRPLGEDKIPLGDSEQPREVVGIDTSQNTVFENGVVRPDYIPIPDSAVANAKASNYDGSKWVANIGPNLPDANGDPSATSVSIGGESFTAVQYSASNKEFSRSTNSGFALSGDPQAVVFTVINNSPDPGDFAYYIDGGSIDEFAVGVASDSGRPLRLRTGDIDERDDDADTNAHTFCIEGSGSNAVLLRDATEVLSATGSYNNLTGFTIAGRGDAVTDNSNFRFMDLEVLEYTILENHSKQQRDDEINRQMREYNV